MLCKNGDIGMAVYVRWHSLLTMDLQFFFQISLQSDNDSEKYQPPLISFVIFTVLRELFIEKQMQSEYLLSL